MKREIFESGSSAFTSLPLSVTLHKTQQHLFLLPLHWKVSAVPAFAK